MIIGIINAHSILYRMGLPSYLASGTVLSIVGAEGGTDVRGDEERVVQAFCAWLRSQGWAVEREMSYVDVVARRGEDRLYAEAKGRTAAIGLDVDTFYGQLLRRMPDEAVGSARFAVVVPEEAVPAALRVPDRVRELLRISVHAVNSEGAVRLAAGE